MFNLGMGEITVILLLALIFLGPKKLPELASGLGKLIREIRKTTADVKNEIQLDEAIRKPFEELREAVTLHPDELKRRDKLRKELADIQRQAEAAVAAAEQSLAQAPAPGDHDGAGPDGPMSMAPSTGEATGHAPGHLDDGPTPHAAHSHGTVGAGQVATDQTLADITAPLPAAVAPGVPGTAPVGTVARTSAGAPAGTGTSQVPPAPPLAAVLAKGSGPIASGDRAVAQPPSGSDFLRSLRAVPDGPKPEGNPAASSDAPGTGIGAGKRVRRSAGAGVAGPPPDSAADRGNITQALTEADLAAITVGPPPPPPPPAVRNVPSAPHVTHAPPTSPRLPGATPPKNPNR